MINDELSHIIRQHVAQAAEQPRPFCYGHIANYDPATHRVRCIIPSMQDDNGTPLLSPWMPMATTSAGSGGGGRYGAQVIYQGGATAQNPTAGEQVVIALFDRTRGVAVCLGTTYSEGAAPPATQLPAGAAPIAAGDVLLSNASQSLFRIRANGDVEIWTTAKLTANVTSDANVTVKGNTTLATTGTTMVSSQGDVTVTSQGNATLSTMGNASVSSKGNVSITAATIASITAPVIRLSKGATDAVKGLCTDAFRTLFNTHTHGTSGPPTPQADATTVTSVVQGE